MEWSTQLKPIVAAMVLSLLFAGELWLPFYHEFGGCKERLRHDGKNLLIGSINAIVIGLCSATTYAIVVGYVEQHQHGLLRHVSWPSGLEALIAFFLLDFWMYLWHRANHVIPVLWRLHRMHHSDPDMDATTAVRFHIGEALLSATVRLIVVALVGVEVWQVVLYESLFLPVVLLHHSNVRLPRWLDRGLLTLIVTPAMHRVHHSRWRPETDSNYGSVFPYWDLLFRTFRLRADAATIRIGLDEMDDPQWQTICGMLKTPLVDDIVRPTAGAASEQSTNRTQTS